MSVTRMSRTTQLRERQIEQRLAGAPVDPDLLSCAAWFAELAGNAPVQHRLYQRGAAILPREKASGIGINSQGGELAPSLVADRIIELRQAAGIIRQNATTWSITRGDEMSVPRRSTGIDVGFLAEHGTLTENSLTWDAITLTPRKIGAAVRVSSELEEDVAVDFANYLMQDAANSLALLEDDCGLNGDGSAVYGGMRGINTLLIDGDHDASKTGAAAGNNTALTLDAADIAAMMALLPEQYWNNAKFYCSGFMFANGLARLAGSVGGNVATGATLSYGGIPVVTSPKMPSGSSDLSGKVMLLFGDMSRAVALGSGRELRFDRSAQRYADLDQVCFRVTERVHIVAHSLGDGDTAGPIVGLIGTSS